MRPFLFLGTRAEDDVAQQEYDAVLAGTGLQPDELVRVRLESTPLGEIDLDEWSGIILGGGPFNVSDPDDLKSATQHRVEAELRALARRVVAADMPFLGACYGIGVLGVLDGGVVDRTYGEPIGALPISLSVDGAEDPLFGILPAVFTAYLGHKEAVSRLPEEAVLLASSQTCPVHAFRLAPTSTPPSSTPSSTRWRCATGSTPTAPTATTSRTSGSHSRPRPGRPWSSNPSASSPASSSCTPVGDRPGLGLRPGAVVSSAWRQSLAPRP